ncbi:hypothetical protein [Thermococcus sp.]
MIMSVGKTMVKTGWTGNFCKVYEEIDVTLGTLCEGKSQNKCLQRVGKKPILSSSEK